jgi:hypothetical protein
LIELAQIEVPHDQVVGIQHQGVVGFAFAERERLATVVAEVPPRPLVQFARDPERRHVVSDQLLRSVGRAGVDDHPGVDERRDAVQQFAHDVGLVADDEVEADRRLRDRRDVTSPECSDLSHRIGVDSARQQPRGVF